jgi:T-complex protein 1 subunit beta
MRQKCDKIIAHGCNVFINRQLIYNLPESIFTEHGVMAIEHADFDGIERLAAVTGGEVVSTFDRPDLVTMGQCDVIEEVRGILKHVICHFHPLDYSNPTHSTFMLD